MAKINNIKERTEKFIEDVSAYKEQHEDGEIRINTHFNPDPDAIGCAMGIQLILKDLGVDSTIYYSGEISHPQNKTIVNVLNIPLIKRTTVEMSEGIDVCVDCTENNSMVSEAFFVVDHHKAQSKSKNQIIDAGFGSCAALVWKMMKEVDHQPSQENNAVYTSLLLGIRTDTNDLVSEYISKDDFSGYQELLDLSDKESLQKVMNYPFPRYLYENRLNLHKEGNSFEKDGVFIGGVGYITQTQRDVIAILAEEYTRMESVTTAFIFAIVDRKELQVSVRSELVSTDVSQVVKDLFGDFGGGKSTAGAARIPLNFYENMSGEESEALWRLTCNQMFKKIMKEQFENDARKD